jgi:hypothetical protein
VGMILINIQQYASYYPTRPRYERNVGTWTWKI